jgi:hypothetical protein
MPCNSGGGPPALKCGGSLLGKSPLPLVEERGVSVVPVAHLAHRPSFHKMFAQDAHFLFRGEFTTGFCHFGLLTKPTLYQLPAAFLFGLEQIIHLSDVQLVLI